MVPLELLTLIFIFVPANQKEVKVEAKKDEEQDQEELDKRGRMCAEMFKRGDLLVVPRTLFTHFGIYLGGGR